MLVKWINHNMCNRKLQLKIGLTTDIIPFLTKKENVYQAVFIIVMLRMLWNGNG
uniref:Uncharacterized protein n=1 Tax=viral metagenome TaxID=1070528 RepID=A0A6C0J6K2_9ZZZZ